MNTEIIGYQNIEIDFATVQGLPGESDPVTFALYLQTLPQFLAKCPEQKQRFVNSLIERKARRTATIAAIQLEDVHWIQ